MRKKLLAGLLLLTLPLLRVGADEIQLLGGTRLTGVVLEESEGAVRLLLPRGDELALLRSDIKQVVPDEEAPAPGKHMRFVTPGEKAGGLEIALTHYVHPDGGPRVDLVAVAHIADKAYYGRLQQILDSANIVLYEAVKPKDMTAEQFLDKTAAEASPIRRLQTKFADWFELSFQLDEIDYRRRHFVHADLTAEEFSGQDAGEGGGEDAAEGSSGTGGGANLPAPLKRVTDMLKWAEPMLDAMLGQPGPMRDNLKAMLAKMMGSADVQGILTTMMPGLSELLLTRRNAVVIERLTEQAKETEGSIAIFYGAAHMTGIEEAMIEKLGYRRAGARWLRAWEIGAAK